MRRLPLRARLVAGFAGAMLVVLVCAGAFVWWRVQFALDHRLDGDLQEQTADLVAAARRATPAAALASLRDEGRRAQLLDASGRVLAGGVALAEPRRSLLSAAEARRALGETVRTGHGYLFSPRGKHLRVLARPVRGPGGTAVAVSAVSLDQRDEALRELISQLVIANLLALALASFVGYRLARAALDPVERYRAQAARIAAGATGVRLDVPDAPEDEITRLGRTLNTMLDAQERAAARQEQFIHDASHDLRTPLSTLAAEIDLALRKPRSNAEYEATLARLADDTQQLVALAETLLALGALGSTAPDAEAIDARGLVERAARRARAQLGEEDARQVVGVALDGLVLHGDPVLLDRALGNMVDNAVRHGGGGVTVTATPHGVAVHDAGPGIPPEFLAHATERFRQHAASRTGPGTGLGLALVDAIATAHGGQLRICANGHHHHGPTADTELMALPCAHPEAGTTVTLLLPSGPA